MTAARIEPASAVRLDDLPERVSPKQEIIVYICPTEGCPSFYAAPDFRADRTDIESVQHYRSQNDGSQVASHSRIECPYCRSQGLRVDRVPYVITEMMPLAGLREFRQRMTAAFEKVRLPDVESG